MIGPEASANPPASSDGILYHYTTQNGLLGILESKSIWATHAGYLNDASEFRRGLGIARRSLEDFKFHPNSDEIFRGVSSFARGEFEEVMAERFRAALGIVDEVDVFIASFFDAEALSTGVHGKDPGDTLNQWRAYSQGGSGFSIGFDKTMLSGHIARMKSKSRLIYSGACNYDEDLQEKSIRDRITRFGSSILEQLYLFIDNFAKEWKQTADGTHRTVLGHKSDEESLKRAEAFLNRSDDFSKAFYRSMHTEFQRIDREIITQLAEIMVPLAFIKHPSFEAENEWRITQFDFRPKSRVKFRPGPSSLVPYLEIPLPLDDPNSNLVRRVVVGPSPKMDEAVLAAKMLLRCKGYGLREHGSKTGIEVVPSQLPFRSW